MRSGQNRIIPCAVVKAILVAGLSMVVVAAPAEAQSQPDSVPVVRNRRPVRRPVIDLDRAAKEVRPGQIVPDGDGSWAPPPSHAPTPPPPLAPPATPAAPSSANPTAPVPAEKPSAAARPSDTAMASAGPMSPERAGEAEPAISSAGQPVRIVVLAAGGTMGDATQAQWRAIGSQDTTWRGMEAGGRTEERVEIRTGLSGSVKIEIDGGSTLAIDRLSRVRVERRARADASEISVELIRGRVELQPVKTDDLGLALEPIRIRTPDAVLLRRSAVAVTYDAFKGTRETPLNGR